MNALLRPYDTANMLVLEAVHPYTSYIENKGDGTFHIKPLPNLVQVAPVNGMVVLDINDDGNLDVLMSGNDYGNEVFSGRLDACRGIVMLGDGKGNLEYASRSETGFLVDGDGKALAKMNTPLGDLIIATQNGDSLRIFRGIAEKTDAKHFMPLMTDSRAELLFADGKKEKIEFYHGSGYLSQSTRAVTIPSGVREMAVYDFSGKRRVIDFQGLAFQDVIR